MSKPLLLIKTGTTIPEIVPAHGDFEHWFEAALEGVRLRRVDVFRGEELPAPGELAGVVITGSAAMVSHREDWSERTGIWLLSALQQHVPVLGVCYGHQLLAHALGGRVGPNPRGREMGTLPVECTDATRDDPLFATTPPSFLAQMTHLETVLEMPPGAELLGRTAQDEHAILRFGELAWGVQYHPEFSAEVMREYIRRRAPLLAEEGLDPAVMLAQVAATPDAAAVLPAFARQVSAARAA
ncbi:MAG: glutamine amidotransferase [Xanthomonadales bacterium]|nr:glutamine amidotransferase [Xanthomonadales bacterium]